jgi:hypothetical protein
VIVLAQVPAEILAAWEDLRRLAIPEEALDVRADELARDPNDRFVMLMAHFTGPLDICLQESHCDKSESNIVLVQVKTRDWPGSVEMEQLKAFGCPPNCRRLVHRWRDRVRLPDVKEL